MSNEPLGIVEQRIRDRQLYGDYAYQAPVIARARSHTISVDLRAGTIERREGPPGFVAPPKPQYSAAELDLMAENALLKADNNRLRDIIAEGPKDQEKPASDGPPPPDRPAIAPEAVMRIFCDVMAAEGHKIHDENWTLDHLRSRRRAREYAWPRHICIHLARRLCVRESLPSLGKVFRRDHSTIIHACRHAPEVMTRDPSMETIHAKVLAAFEAQQ